MRIWDFSLAFLCDVNFALGHRLGELFSWRTTKLLKVLELVENGGPPLVLLKCVLHCPSLQGRLWIKLGEVTP